MPQCSGHVFLAFHPFLLLLFFFFGGGGCYEQKMWLLRFLRFVDLFKLRALFSCFVVSVRFCSYYSGLQSRRGFDPWPLC